MISEAIIYRYRFPHEMVAHSIWFIPQQRLMSQGNIYHIHVIPINVTWVYSFHPKFLPKTSKSVHSMLHGIKFGSKHGSFHSRIFIWKLLNQIQIRKYHKTSARAPGGLVSWVVAVDHHPQVYTLSKRRNSVWRYRLIDVTMKGGPVFLSLKVLLNNFQIGRVKSEASSVSLSGKT